MNGRHLEQIRFIEEQLYESKRALFCATTVREAKFLQSKIRYLSDQAKRLAK